MDRGRRSILAFVGLALVLVGAPLCAIADGLGPHGSFEQAPAHMQAFRRWASPLLDFADWETVYHVWEIPLGLGLLLVLGAAVPAVRAAPAQLPRAALRAAAGAAALFALGAALEGLALSPLLTNVGVAGTFLFAPLALLSAPVAGGLALWRRALPKAVAWALVAVPLLVVLTVLVVPHIPGAPAVALALGWLGAATAATASPRAS